MKIYIAVLSAAAVLSLNSAELSAIGVRTPVVDVEVGTGPYYYYNDTPEYQVWAGPGWYYGIWFDNEETYYDWLDNRFYDASWTGPGWYYGVWFDDEPYFNDFRRRHRHHERGRHRGNRDWHQSERQGKWQEGSRDGRSRDGREAGAARPSDGGMRQRGDGGQRGQGGGGAGMRQGGGGGGRKQQ